MAASKYCKDPNYARAKRKKEIMGELKSGEQNWVRIGIDGSIKGLVEPQKIRSDQTVVFQWLKQRAH